MDIFSKFQANHYKKCQYKISDIMLNKKKYEKRNNLMQICKNKMENRRFGREIKNINYLTEIQNSLNSEVSKIGEILSKINKYSDRYNYKANINLENKMTSMNNIIKDSKIKYLIKENTNRNLSIRDINRNYYRKARYSSISSRHNNNVSDNLDKYYLRNNETNSKYNQGNYNKNPISFKYMRKNLSIIVDDSRRNLNYSNYANINNVNYKKYKLNINKYKNNNYNTINTTNNEILNNNNLRYTKRIINNENIDTLNINNKISKEANNDIKESNIMRFIRKQYNLPRDRESRKILNLSLNYRQKSNKEIQSYNYKRKSHFNVPKRNENVSAIPINRNNLERYNHKQNNTSIIYSRNINPQIPKEYINDIYKYLKTIENKDLPLRNYMEVIQKDINHKMRLILLDWLVEIHIKYNLLDETLFISVNLIDRFLSKKSIHRKYLQLLGITSLLIASKYEEIYPPEIKELINMTDNAYSKNQVIKMENEILDAVHVNISFPTSLKFLEIFKNKLNLSKNNFYSCLYFIEISLIDYKSSFFSPSLIASTSLLFNLMNKNGINELEYDEKSIFNLTGYNKSDMKDCFDCLNNAIKNLEKIGSKYNSIRRKFKQDKFLNVSNKKYYIEENGIS